MHQKSRGRNWSSCKRTQICELFDYFLQEVGLYHAFSLCVSFCLHLSYIHLHSSPSTAYYELTNWPAATAGLITQLVEHCTDIADVVGLNPVLARIFFRLQFHNCLSCV